VTVLATVVTGGIASVAVVVVAGAVTVTGGGAVVVTGTVSTVAVVVVAAAVEVAAVVVCAHGHVAFTNASSRCWKSGSQSEPRSARWP
jgi:hypothetical protein